jgi:hypothetical protein
MCARNCGSHLKDTWHQNSKGCNWHLSKPVFASNMQGVVLQNSNLFMFFHLHRVLVPFVFGAYTYANHSSACSERLFPFMCNAFGNFCMKWQGVLWTTWSIYAIVSCIQLLLVVVTFTLLFCEIIWHMRELYFCKLFAKMVNSSDPEWQNRISTKHQDICLFSFVLSPNLINVMFFFVTLNSNDATFCFIFYMSLKCVRCFLLCTYTILPGGVQRQMEIGNKYVTL